VKHTFRSIERAGNVSARILTRKPIVPSEDEIASDPRARCAKLRAIERLA
jgi:16S rRNA C1402 N4-methylase RsmH